MYSIEKESPIGIITVFEKYLSFRRVDKKGNVLAGKPLYKNTAKKLFKSIYGETQEIFFRDIIHPKIKFFSNKEELKIVWTFKKTKKKIFFENGIEKKVFIPNLIFKINGTTLSLVAYKSFSKKGKVYKAPFNNIFNNKMCLGTASLKLKKFNYVEDIIEYAEKQFFLSEFTGKIKDEDEHILKGYFPEKLIEIKKINIENFIKDE